MVYPVIFDVIKIDDFKFKSHYRVYKEDRSLLTEGDYIYTIIKPRRMTPGVVKAKITTGIHHRLCAQGIIQYKDRFKTSCLVTNDVIKKEMEKSAKPETPKVKEVFEKKIEVESNPRIYRVVLINGNYTIVKAETQYLTRDQAKELLFSKQLEEA